MIRIRFQHSLDELKELLLVMGGLAEQAIQRAVEGYSQSDVELCQAVIAADKDINELQRRIDAKAVDMLALEQPMAVDLRFILAVLRMNENLERVGDQAVHIARLAKDASLWPATDMPVDIPRLAALSAAMINRSLRAFVEGSATQAESVLTLDDEVDDLYRAAFRSITAEIQQRPELTQQALNALLVARNLERIGDHATNIAEDVIFWASGMEARGQMVRTPAAA